MTAANTTYATADDKKTREFLRRGTRERKLPNALPLGTFLISATVAATEAALDEQDDRGLVIEFPANQNAYLLDFMAVMEEGDSHATPTLDVDFVVTDGTTDTNIITATTTWQAGGRDRMDADSAAYGANLKGKYIGWIVNAGVATFAANDLTVYALVYAGDLISLTE